MADGNLSLMLFPEGGGLKLVDRPIPEPEDGEVQIKLETAGICGTDVHIVRDCSFLDMMLTAPIVPGHEGSGMVTKLGPGVTSLQVGDRVAIEPLICCAQCHLCCTGSYNVCPKMRVVGLSPTHSGSMARYLTHRANMCHKLPDHVSFEEGAMLEPLSVTIQAFERVNFTLGETVVIIGAGKMGIFALLTARASGASKVCIAGSNQKKLDLAKTCGADVTVLVGRDDPPKVAALKIIEAMGAPADVSIETVGVSNTVNLAIHSTRNGGRISQIGIDEPSPQIRLVDLVYRGISLHGSIAYAHNYPTALNLVATGKVDLRPLVSLRLPLEQGVKAFEEAAKSDIFKVIIQCGQ